MNSSSLPKDLDIHTDSPIQLFDYRTFNSLNKGKINLTKNTFSFLVQGTKEVISENKSVKIENDNFLILKSGNCLMTETVSSHQKIYKSILLFFTDEVLLNFIEKNNCLPNRKKRY